MDGVATESLLMHSIKRFCGDNSGHAHFDILKKRHLYQFRSAKIPKIQKDVVREDELDPAIRCINSMNQTHLPNGLGST